MRDSSTLANPIHPELFDRLFGDWSTLERFQRTRGVLRIMAEVVHALWIGDDPNLLIMPSTIPIDDNDVAEELLGHLDADWRTVVETGVDGSGALPSRIDREHPSLGRFRAARKVARTVYFGTAPSQQVANRGLDDRSIKLGCVQPGAEKPAVYGDALRRLSDQAMYLHLGDHHRCPHPGRAAPAVGPGDVPPSRRPSSLPTSRTRCAGCRTRRCTSISATIIAAHIPDALRRLSDQAMYLHLGDHHRCPHPGRAAPAVGPGDVPPSRRPSSLPTSRTRCAGCRTRRCTSISATIIAAHIPDALRRLSDQAMYLYRDGARYWYALQPTVNRMARDRAENHFSDDDTDEVIRGLVDDALRQDRGHFTGVHACPRGPADVPDEDETRLVALDPTSAHGTKVEQSEALRIAERILLERSGGARQFCNMLVFLAVDAARLRDLRQAVRSCLAWDSIGLNNEDRHVLALVVRR